MKNLFLGFLLSLTPFYVHAEEPARPEVPVENAAPPAPQLKVTPVTIDGAELRRKRLYTPRKLRMQIQQKRNMLDKTLDEAKKEELKREITDLESEFKKMQKDSRRESPKDFFEDLPKKSPPTNRPKG